MKDDNKTKKQLVDELTELRLQNAALEKLTPGGITYKLVSEEACCYAESIVETVREPLVVLDEDLKIISANHSFYRTFKVRPSETVGSFIYDLGNKQWDIPKLRVLLEELLPENEVFNDFEVEHEFQDIGHKFMLLNARQVYRKDIDTKMILLAIEDITERKQAELVLKISGDDTIKISEERYRNLFERMDEAFCVVEMIYDPDGKAVDYRFVEINPAFDKHTGLHQALGKTIRQMVPHHEAYWFEIYGKVARTGESVRFENTAYAMQRHYDVYAFRIGGDESQRVGILFNDITKRKQAEEMLLTKTMLLEAQSETSIDGILAVDNGGRSILMNKRFGELWKIPQHILDEKDDAMMLEYILKQLKDPEEFRRKVAYLYEHHDEKSRDEVVFADGRTFDRYSSPLLSTNGQHLGRIWFFRDITERKQAEDKLKQALENLRESFIASIQLMVSAVEARDPYTAGHQVRSTNLACAIATEMGLPQEKIVGLRMAGSIHDIGKLSIPAEILSKPTRLTEIEFSLIKEHTQTGYQMLKDVESPWPLAEIVYQHHERMDGSGYPRNLKGDEIIIEARIMAVADVVESMASHRPYRPSLGIEAALKEIEKNKGTLYDDAVADACLRLFRGKGFQFERT